MDDGNSCTLDGCDALAGVTHTPVSAGTSCSNGNACEACDGTGACANGVAPTVDDGNSCTADGCDALARVTHTPLTAGTSCSNGNACDGLEACDGLGTCANGYAQRLHVWTVLGWLGTHPCPMRTRHLHHYSAPSQGFESSRGFGHVTCLRPTPFHAP
ncbi:MAG: hypothetical protein HY791_30405 [Deltaproteobacteria bacterium]|nr:hypothetical protein [Deltaproteobacteria bacterium]